MSDVSAAGRSVNATAPNLLSQTSNIIQQLQGISTSNADGSRISSGMGSAIGHQSLFDTELFQTNVLEAKAEGDRKDISHRKSTSDLDSAYTHNPRRDDVQHKRSEGHKSERITKESIENVAEDPIAAPREQASNERVLHDDSDGGVAGVASESETLASHNNQATDVQPLDAVEKPVGTAEELLAAAQVALAQIEEFITQYPNLAQQLDVIIAPLTQSLEQLTAQLGSLAPNTLVGSQQLGGQTFDAFARLEQFANLFNRQQQLVASGSGGQLLGGEIPEEFAQALKSLSNASGETLVKVNQIAEAFRSLVPTDQPVRSEQATQNLAASLKQAANGPAINTQVKVAADPQLAPNLAVQQTTGASPIKSSDQQSTAGGNNNNSGAQQQAQANAQLQVNAQAPQAANSNVSNARGEPSLGASTSLSSSAPTPSQAASGVGQTMLTLTKEAANFEQALKQAGKPSVSEQVQVQIKSMARDGMSKFIVKLDPPQLGELELRMQVNKNAEVKLVVTVERQGTLELLQRDSRMLMQALQDAGLQADSSSLSFNLKGGNDSQGEGQQQGKNVYPIAEEQFDEQMLSVVSEDYLLDMNEMEGVNIHA